MNIELSKFKEALLNSGLFKHKTAKEYTCQCPYCSDNHEHCYVKIDVNTDDPVVFWCHKCTAHGMVKQDFLDKLDTDIRVPFFKGGNKLRVTKGVSVVVIDDILSEKDDISRVCSYIEERVGVYPTFDDLKIFQYIGNPKKYAVDYLGYNGDGKPFWNRHWFKLTNGGIIGRWGKGDKDDTLRWLRFKSPRVSAKGLYSMKKGFDPFKDVNVCIAEGIMDVIGLYYNYPVENGVYIATLGKGYESGITHMLSKGLFGSSINIKIFLDSNVSPLDVHIDPLMKRLFNKIEMYHNVIGDDFGLPKNEVEIKKYMLRSVNENGYAKGYG